MSRGPQNQGAWFIIKSSIERCLQRGASLVYAGREFSAAPAAGYPSLHKQQQDLVDQALGLALNSPEEIMTVEIKVPELPESVSDATIAAWHKKVGDFVTSGDILDLETDKIMLEVLHLAVAYLLKYYKKERCGCNRSKTCSY